MTISATTTTPLRPAAFGVWCTLGALVLTGCVSLDEPEEDAPADAGTEESAEEDSEPGEGEDEPGESDEPSEEPDESPDSEVADGHLADFCAGDPEVTDADEERIMEIGYVPEGDPEEISMPYLDQLDADDDFVPASEDGPAEEVPVPEFSALLCDEDAGLKQPPRC